MDFAYDVLQKLIEKGLTISFAESCTGGGAVNALVRVPNASWVVSESYVTYTALAKEKILGVKHETIEKHTVFSVEVAQEMAVGVKELSGANIGVGITGIAGPSGGDHKNPVGTVCFCIATDNDNYTSKMLFSRCSRNEVIDKAIEYVYSFLMEVLNSEN